MARMPRYHVRAQPVNESHSEDYYDKHVKSVKQGFWWINNKMTDSWEAVFIYDKKEDKVVKWLNEPRYE